MVLAELLVLKIKKIDGLWSIHIIRWMDSIQSILLTSCFFGQVI